MRQQRRRGRYKLRFCRWITIEKDVSSCYKVNTVCRALEEYGNEKAAEARKEKAVEVAKKLLQDGSMPLERIADIADLPLQQIQQLAEQVKA